MAKSDEGSRRWLGRQTQKRRESRPILLWLAEKLRNRRGASFAFRARILVSDHLVLSVAFLTLAKWTSEPAATRAIIPITAIIHIERGSSCRGSVC